MNRMGKGEWEWEAACAVKCPARKAGFCLYRMAHL